MLDPELLSSLIKKVLARGGEYADVFVERRRSMAILLEDGKIEKMVDGVDSGVGIRLIAGGRTAYAFSNDLSRKSLVELSEGLSRTFSGSGKDLYLDLRNVRPSVDFPVMIPPETVTPMEKVNLVRGADAAARSVGPEVRQVTVTYRDARQKIQIATSDGTIAEDERTHTVASIQVITTDGSVFQTGSEAEGGHIGFELFQDLSLEELALRASHRAVRMLRARRAPGGRMPIVISSEAGGTLIHEAIGHGLEADLAQQGLSVYSRRIGDPVASSLVTVIDDSTLPGKRGSFRFDDEGVPSQRRTLVDHGILVSYLYDRLSAMRDKVSSSGSGRRESYQHRPIPRMTNTFIAPGSTEPGDVIRSTHRGLFVTKMGGGQVNTVTGDFVFDVQEGYLIEGGAVGEPVRGATLTGNGPGVLKAIDMVGSDLGFSIGTCGKDSQGVPVSDAMPTIRVAEMVVGGEVKV